MEFVKFECRSCGAVEYRSVRPDRPSVVGMIQKLENQADCCSEPDYSDDLGFLKRIRQSSVAQMY